MTGKTSENSDESIYREEIRLFSPLFKIIYFILVLGLIWALMQSQAVNPVLLATMVIIMGIPAVFGRMLITIEGEKLQVHFGYLGWPGKNISLQNITGAKVITCNPMRQFGGWGIRRGMIEEQPVACYSMKGNQGILLSLASEIGVFRSSGSYRRFFLGSLQPDELRKILERKGITFGARLPR